MTETEKGTTKKIGDCGEDKAADFLKEKGYEIIFRNYRTRGGEIDIIVGAKDLIVFAEVKTLPSGNLETLNHELDSKKQKKIIETAKIFLSKYRKYNERCVRFDVLVVDMPGFPSVYHIENAFSELL